MPRRARSCSIFRRAASFVLVRTSSVGGPRLPRDSATLTRCSSRHAAASRASFFSRYLLDACLHFSFFSSEAISNLKMNRDIEFCKQKRDTLIQLQNMNHINHCKYTLRQAQTHSEYLARCPVSPPGSKVFEVRFQFRN